MDTIADPFAAAKLAQVPNPCAVAAGLARQTIGEACQAHPEQAEAIVVEACASAIKALARADQDLGCGAVLIVSAVCDGEATTALEPAALLKAALSGMGRVGKSLTSAQVNDIQRKLERRYAGAGETFSMAAASA